MNKGKLIFKYGVMNSGKSLQLLANAYNFTENSIPFILIKSDIDDRDGSDVIHSRALGDKPCVGIKQTTDISALIGDIFNYTDDYINKNPKWILVDEAQFLTPKQVDELAFIADNYGISVICYGLRTDFQGKLFPGSKRLFELADSFEEIKASCSCGCKATMNARVDENGKIVTEGDQIEIGGNEKYITLCRRCFFDRTRKKEQ